MPKGFYFFPSAIFVFWIVINYNESKEVVRTLGGTLWGGRYTLLSIYSVSGTFTCSKNPKEWVLWSPLVHKIAEAQGN